ncbi:hypothetical protein HDK90DRAFT_461324 [Phyllosticta capitalensis]|uniref:Fungal N-terminal domain-containing protein n=1 Tax=Phyllosticta capitalensis TaxID=121624 RepID=A0ABR1Z368_9PEZI
MADPLSIISFVGGTATAGFELSKTLYQLVDTVKNGREEMERIANRIEDTAQTLETLEDVLGRAEGLYKPGLIKSTRSITQRFERLMDQLRTHIQTEGRMQRVKWVWKKLKVEPLVTELGGYMSLLTMQIVIFREVVEIDKHKPLPSASQTEKIERAAKANRFRIIVEAVMQRNRLQIIKLQELKSKETRKSIHGIRRRRSIDYIEPKPWDQTGQLQTWRVSDKIVADRTAAWLQQMLFAPAQNDSPDSPDSPNQEQKPPVWNGPTVEEVKDSEGSDHEPTRPSNHISTSRRQSEEVNSLANGEGPHLPASVENSTRAVEKMPLPDHEWKPDPVLTTDRLLRAWSTLTEEQIEESHVQETNRPPTDRSPFLYRESEREERQREIGRNTRPYPTAELYESPFDEDDGPYTSRSRSPERRGRRSFSPEVRIRRTPAPGRRGRPLEETKEVRFPPELLREAAQDQRPGFSNQISAPDYEDTYKDTSGNVLEIRHHADGRWKGAFIIDGVERSRDRTSQNAVQKPDFNADKVLLHNVKNSSDSRLSKLESNLSENGVAAFYEQPSMDLPKWPMSRKEVERQYVMHGSILWEPPTSQSDFLLSLEEFGLNVIYVRGSDKGQTWFCGTKPFHVNFCSPEYVPQTGPWDSESKVPNDAYLAIGKEWVEVQALQNKGIPFRDDHHAFYFLAPGLQPELGDVVVSSLAIREESLRRKTCLRVGVQRSPPTPLTGGRQDHFMFPDQSLVSTHSSTDSSINSSAIRPTNISTNTSNTSIDPSTNRSPKRFWSSLSRRDTKARLRALGASHRRKESAQTEKL